MLVAEDNTVNQLVARRMLERHGCLTDVAATGKAAVEAARDGAYDLILMDCEMPEMDGFDAARTIREAERGTSRRVPIVAITANTLRGDRERCLAAGMDDYLSKPVTTDALDAMVVRWLGAARPAPAVVAAAPAPPAADVLDASAIAELEAGGGPELRDELIALFNEDAPSALEKIRAAAAAGDAAELGRVAHALKGSSATIGARLMSATCASLEAAGRAGQIADQGPAIVELERQMSDVLQALAALVANGSADADATIPAAAGDGGAVR